MRTRKRSRRFRPSVHSAFHPSLEQLEPRWALSVAGPADLAGPWCAPVEQPGEYLGAASADVAGQSFSTAHDLGKLAGSREVRDQVGQADSRDVFRFELSREGDVAVRLDGLNQDIDLFLYDHTGRLLERSANGGRQAESIDRTLAPGSYYVVVNPFWQFSSSYRLSLNAPVSEPVPADGAGNRLSDAKDLGLLGNARTIEDWVGAQDAADFYRFHLNGTSQVDLSLQNLRADADLFLMSADGSVRSQSMAAGNQNESIATSLSAGEYFVLVRPWHGAESGYRLSLAATQTTAPEPDNDGPFPEVPYFGGPNDWNLNRINAPEAWARGFTGEGVTVAVVDTGVDLTHPELVSNLWVNADEIPGNGRDDDGNGFVDDYRGWDFAGGDNDPADQNGHGTHVAGTIAAANGGHGTTGVAPGATVMPVQVLGASGSGSTSAVAAGIRYAVDNGAGLINLSLGGGFSSTILSALQYAADHAVMVIAASGNRGAASPDYPAAHSATLSNVLSVEAHTADDAKATFSNGAAGAVQVSAPGVDIYSTFAGGGFSRLSGTSMATPHVTGLAALALSANPALGPQQLRAILVEGADRLISGAGAAGGVDAAVTVARAVALAADSSSSAVASGGLTSTSATLSTFWSRSTPVTENASLEMAPATTASGQAPRTLAEDRDARIRAIDEWFALSALASVPLGSTPSPEFAQPARQNDLPGYAMEVGGAEADRADDFLPPAFDALGRLPSTAPRRLV